MYASDVTKTVNGILDHWQKQRPAWAKYEPVNWADLHCIEVRRAGDEWDVIIAEAAPNAYELRSHVADELAERGITADVFTEW